jgi:eukaryotic-like serine/threonine-protein kinase
LPPPLQIGRYVLHGEIASGGMAKVHFGRLVGTAGFAKTVAIKRLHRSLASTDSFRKMILEEARLAARVRHPNVVPPLDVVEERGELLLVMEYVHGESLARLLRAARTQGERAPLPVGAAILANVLHGLHAAHEARDESGAPLDIVHRDISPQNIMVGVDGVARVIDFGIAKAVTSEEMTSAGTVKGKVPYLSPEQLEGSPATRRTDVYAAAVVFWEVLTGRRLFGGNDDGEILRQIMGMDVEPPSALNPLVAGVVDDVVLKALARDPNDRFASARDMALALEAAVHLATATVVGAWTERLAAETLAERAERIREVEGAASSRDGAPSPGSGRTPAAADVELPAPSPARPTSPPPLPPAARPPPSPMQPTPSAIPAPPSRGAPRITIPPPPAPGAPRMSLPPQSGPQSGPPSGQGAQPRSRPPSSTRATPAPPSGARASTLPVRPPAAAHAVIEPRTVIYEPPPMPEPEFVEGVRPLSRDAPAPPPAGALRKPEIAIRNVEWLPPREATAPVGSPFKRFMRYLAAFLVLALITAWMFAPALMRAWLVTGASARGITLTIDRVDVSRRAIRLSDVRAESTELPGASMRTGTVVIGLRWLVPEKVSFDDAEVSLDGPYSVVAGRIDRYRATHGAAVTGALGGITQVEITSGRVDWKNLLGAGTSALVENVTLDMTKKTIRALGDDYHLSAPLFTMRLADAPAGPWQLDVDRQGILVRSVVRFDPVGMYPAKVTRTAGDDGSVSIALEVTPTTLADLHLPAAVFGGVASSRTRLEAHGDINIVAVQQTTTRGAAEPASASDGGLAATDAGVLAAAPPTLSRSVSGHIVLAAGGLNVFPAGPLVDLSLDLPFVGDTAAPVGARGVLAVAPATPGGGASAAVASAVMVGSLDLSGPAVKVALTGTTGPIPCARDGAAAPGAKPSAAGEVSGLAAEIAGTLDDLPGAKVHFVPLSACIPRLK